jgi:hypothetical protein
MTLTTLTNTQIPDKAILDTFGRQTYLGNSYLISTNVVNIVSANTETPLLIITNPAANSHPRSIALFQAVRKLSQASNVSSATTIFRFYLNPTLTGGGTPLTPGNLRTGSTNTSIATAGVSPTTSSNGTYIAAFPVNYQEIDSSVLFIIDPGSAMLLTATTDTGNTKVVAELSWWEL